MLIPSGITVLNTSIGMRIVESDEQVHLEIYSNSLIRIIAVRYNGGIQTGTVISVYVDKETSKNLLRVEWLINERYRWHAPRWVEVWRVAPDTEFGRALRIDKNVAWSNSIDSINQWQK